YEEPRAGRRREFTQAGIELIGAHTADADAEAIALAIDALRAMGLHQLRLNIGQMAYFKALIADLNLSAEQVSQLNQASERRAGSQLLQILETLPIADECKRILAQLPHWRHHDDWLADARALCVNPQTHAAIDELATVIARLQAYDLAETIRV